VNLPPAWRRETRQFRQLVRLSYRRLLDAALSSREIDAEQFALWGVALLATPPLYAAMIWPSRYPWLRRRSLDLLQSAVVGDRLFFVAWSVLAALLVGALLWDGLFPDRTDQQVMGVLPVRSRTVAAARVTAALVSVVVLLAAINLPAATLYALAGAAHPSVGSVPGIFVGQMLASIAAGLAAFSILLAARGAVAWLFGASGAARIAVVLQLLAVVGTVEALMFLPGLLGTMVREVIASGETTGGSPLAPVWFLGVYALFAGPHAEVLTPMAGPAVVVLVVGVAAAIAIYLLPASLAARRAIESQDRDHTAALLVAPLLACGMVFGRPSARARYVFVIQSLVRSRRHLLMVASYLGLGIAVAGTRVVTASLRSRLALDQPADYLLVIPLTVTFFLVLGVRAAFAIPTDVAANWTFRVVGPRHLLDSRSAARVALYAVAVLPVSGVTAMAAAWLWGIGIAATMVSMHLAAGALVCEMALRGHESVPFTKGRALSTSSMKVGVAVAIGIVYLFAFRFDGLQLWAVSRPSRAAAYVLVALAITVAVAVSGRRRSRAETASFDAPDDHAVTQLRLSEASS
jgi:hypothetical protein